MNLSSRFATLFAAAFGLAAASLPTARGQNIFVTNFSSGTIAEYTTSGTAVNASLVSGLDHPFGLALSGSDLFVTNEGDSPGAGTIGEYTTSGGTVNASLVSGLDNPYGIAVSGSVSSVPDVGSTSGLMFLSLTGIAALRRRLAK